MTKEYLKSLNDTEFYELRDLVKGEETRRADLLSIPEDVARLARNYLSADGTKQNLVNKIESIE